MLCYFEIGELGRHHARNIAILDKRIFIKLNEASTSQIILVNQELTVNTTTDSRHLFFSGGLLVKFLDCIAKDFRRAEKMVRNFVCGGRLYRSCRPQAANLEDKKRVLSLLVLS